MASKERSCALPTCQNIGKHLCSGCGEDIYCSKDCQKAHWPTHKKTCKTAVKPEAAIFLQSFDSLSIKQLKNLMKAKAATFETKKRNKVLEKLESLVEKPALVKLVKEYVSPNEIEALLSASGTNRAAATAEAANIAAMQNPNTANSSSSAARKKIIRQATTGNGANPTPTPAQLREQAAFMRKNPAMVRKAQPAFANLTDEQIREYANQLEQAANDPNMMKEVERMSKLDNDERALLQNIQEGLSGAKPIDDTWITSIVNAIKEKPGVFKTMLRGKGAMFGGVTDEQIDSYIDMASRMELFTLRLIAYSIWYLSSAVKPLTAVYKTIDTYTLGSGRFLLLALFVVSVYYVGLVSFYVIRWFAIRIYVVGELVYKLVTGSSSVASTLKSAASSAATTGAATASKSSVGLKETLEAASTLAAAAAGGAAAMGGGKFAAEQAATNGGATGQQSSATGKSTEREDAEFEF